MKTRKMLKITFPHDCDTTLFLWNRHHMGYEAYEEAPNVLVVAVQRRTARRDIAQWARGAYHATTETIVVK